VTSNYKNGLGGKEAENAFNSEIFCIKRSHFMDTMCQTNTDYLKIMNLTAGRGRPMCQFQ
jgi:hypothetical protein